MSNINELRKVLAKSAKKLTTEQDRVSVIKKVIDGNTSVVIQVRGDDTRKVEVSFDEDFDNKWLVKLHYQSTISKIKFTDPLGLYSQGFIENYADDLIERAIKERNVYYS